MKQNIARVLTSENKNIKHSKQIKNMSQRAHENRKDFKFFEKTSVEEICFMCGERLFQARGAETEKARSPNVDTYVARQWKTIVPTADQLCCLRWRSGRRVRRDKMAPLRTNSGTCTFIHSFHWVPSVTRCRCRCRCRRCYCRCHGHRCAGGARQYR